MTLHVASIVFAILEVTFSLKSMENSYRFLAKLPCKE